MQKNKLIRNLDAETIRKLNNLCKILNLKQNQVIKLVINDYFLRHKEKIKEKLLKIVS